MTREAEKQTAFSFKLAAFGTAGRQSERCDKNITKGFYVVQWRRATLRDLGLGGGPAIVAGAGGKLASLRDELASIGAMPRQGYGDLSRADGALKRWRDRFAQLREKLVAVSGRLDSFHYCREHSEVLAQRTAGIVGSARAPARLGRGGETGAGGERYLRAGGDSRGGESGELAAGVRLVDGRAGVPGMRGQSGRIPAYESDAELDDGRFGLAGAGAHDDAVGLGRPVGCGYFFEHGQRPIQRRRFGRRWRQIGGA